MSLAIASTPTASVELWRSRILDRYRPADGLPEPYRMAGFCARQFVRACQGAGIQGTDEYLASYLALMCPMLWSERYDEDTIPFPVADFAFIKDANETWRLIDRFEDRTLGMVEPVRCYYNGYDDGYVKMELLGYSWRYFGGTVPIQQNTPQDEQTAKEALYQHALRDLGLRQPRRVRDIVDIEQTQEITR